jgi:hypothetical protein
MKQSLHLGVNGDIRLPFYNFLLNAPTVVRNVTLPVDLFREGIVDLKCGSSSECRDWRGKQQSLHCTVLKAYASLE